MDAVGRFLNPATVKPLKMLLIFRRAEGSVYWVCHLSMGSISQAGISNVVSNAKPPRRRKSKTRDHELRRRRRSSSKCSRDKP